MQQSVTPEFRLGLLAGALCAAFAAPAQAQETDAAAAPAAAPAEAAPVPAASRGASDDGMQVVVVTAQKRKEKLQDIPIAATAVTGLDLERRGVANVADLGSIAPNVSVSHTPGNSTSAQIAIRGSVTINPALYWEPTVGMYVDGVYSGKTQGAVLDLVDLERVEVLRGPQGTLYGRNTMAGAINFVTRKPSGELGGSASLDLGNYNARVGKASLDLPQVGIFKASIGARVDKRDGWVKTTPGSSVTEMNDRDGKSARIAIDAQATPDLLLSYRYDFTRAKQNGNFSQIVQSDLPFPGVIVSPAGRVDLASVDGPQMEQMKVYGNALTAEWKISDSNTVKYTWADRKLNWFDTLDLDGSPVQLVNIGRFSTYSQRSHELQLIGSRGKLYYVFGLFDFQDRGHTDNPQSFFFGSSVFDSRYGFTTDTQSAYGQVDYQLTERLKFTAGMRHTSEEKTIDRFLDGGGALIPAGTTGSADFKSNTPLVSAAYKFSERFNVYAKYAEGFKSGGFNGEASSVAETLTPFRPEKLKSVELGFKSSFDAGRTTFNGAFFQNRTTDLQESIFTAEGAAGSNIRNAGKTTTRGVELELGMRPTEDLRLTASYGYLHGKYDEFIELGVDVSDNRAMVHIPKHSVNLMADAVLARRDYGVWRLLADYSFIDAHYTYPYQLRRTDPTVALAGDSLVAGAGFLNLRLSLSGLNVGKTRAELALWARNVLDKEHIGNYIDFGPGFSNLRQAYYAQPRTFGVSLKATF